LIQLGTPLHALMTVSTAPLKM